MPPALCFGYTHCMEPPPAGTTRPYTAADCRKEALLQGIMCAVCLNMVFSPPHWALLLRWAVILLFLVLGCIYTRSTMYWLVLSRYMGQTVTFRIGPRGHAWWQRTVTLPIPQLSLQETDRLLSTPQSVAYTFLLTVGAGLLTFAAFMLLSSAVRGSIPMGLILLAIDVPLIVYTVYCWKRVRQDRQRLKAQQHTP